MLAQLQSIEKDTWFSMVSQPESKELPVDYYKLISLFIGLSNAIKGQHRIPKSRCSAAPSYILPLMNSGMSQEAITLSQFLKRNPLCSSSQHKPPNVKQQLFTQSYRPRFDP